MNIVSNSAFEHIFEYSPIHQHKNVKFFQFRNTTHIIAQMPNDNSSLEKNQSLYKFE